MRYLFVFFMLYAGLHEAWAATCPTLIFPSLSTCPSTNCNILFDVRPSGTARLLKDNKYGNQLLIKFGQQSIFELGNSGRLNFGNTGGLQAVAIDASGTLSCTPFSAGNYPYTVNITPGGWLLFSSNNRFDLNAHNVFSLGGFSEIDGRLDIQSEGTVNIGSSGEMALPNVDVDAANGITISGKGNVQLGNLQNQGASADNQGIIIYADGDVTIDTVDSNDDFSVTAGGNISIGEIRNADSISLVINPPNAGVIRIAGKQTTDNPVICASTDDCNGFVPDGGSDGDSCNTVNSDPNVPNNCGGGAAGPGFLLLCAVTLLRRRIRLYKNRVGDCLRCSPVLGRSV
jgi:hypothetical protein